MAGRRLVLTAAMSWLALAGVSAFAQDNLYVRRFGAPKTRVQGGTRGAADAVAQVVLSEETALTASAQPVLYWFLSEDWSLRAEVTLREQGAEKPLLQVRLPRGAAKGLHPLSLADAGVSLVSGRIYQFEARLVPDPTLRDADRVSRGLIGMEPHAPFTAARDAAGAGFFLDAFALAGQTERAQLLTEVGLGPLARQLEATGG